MARRQLLANEMDTRRVSVEETGSYTGTRDVTTATWVSLLCKKRQRVLSCTPLWAFCPSAPSISSNITEAMWPVWQQLSLREPSRCPRGGAAPLGVPDRKTKAQASEVSCQSPTVAGLKFQLRSACHKSHKPCRHPRDEVYEPEMTKIASRPPAQTEQHL